MGNIPIELLVAGVGVGAVVLIMVCSRWWAGLMLISGMCFFASLGYSQAHFEETGGTILGPLQTTRSVLYLAAGVLVYVSLFLHYQRTPGRYAPQAVALLLIGVYAAVMRVAHGAPLDAAQTLVFVPVTQLGVIMLTSKSLSDPDRWLTVFRWIMVCSVLWTGVVLLQLGINAGAVLRPGPFFTRFQGLTGNPQGAALQLGVTSTIALFLALNETKGRYRLVWPVLTAVNVVLLMWTGSRTGMGMFTIGAAAVLYSRLSRAILLLPVIGIVGIVAFTLVGDTSDIVNTASRLTSTENTRANAWTTLLRLSAENPLTGVGMEKEAREGASENSYLLALASFGWGMGILVVALLLTAGAMCLRLFAYRRRASREFRPWIDLVLGYNAMYFAGAMFEGYFVARVNIHVIIFYVMAALGANLLFLLGREREESAAAGYESAEEHSDALYSEQYGEHVDPYGYEHEDEPSTV